MAGIIGSSRARPRLSPCAAAISAICCAATAGSHALKVAKTAPARAVPATEVERVFEVVRPFGRFFRERREMGFVVDGLEELMMIGVFGELVVKHLALSMAIADMVAAAAAIWYCWFLLLLWFEIEGLVNYV